MGDRWRVLQHTLDQSHPALVARGVFPKSCFNVDEALEEVPRVNMALLTIPRKKWIRRVGEFRFERGKLGL